MSANSLAPDEPSGQGTDGAAFVPQRQYSLAQLARHDGGDPGLPVLIAYQGKVYDVTASYPWAKGLHWGDHRAGRDLTGCMKESIHGKKCCCGCDVSEYSIRKVQPRRPAGCRDR